ncbi:MAG: Ig-like domain-containing protein [Cryomorphaceae bacterium]|nr:Ig-like domain-containing protein [Cryomorphaceae bacterium]
MKSTIRNFLLFLLLLTAISPVFFSRCANIGVVEGGPRDTAAPKILRTVPANEKTNFNASSFTLFFDEFLQPSGIANEITTSPPLKKKVKATLRGKILDVEWTDTLKENTTYLFQFGDGLKDLNEGNVQKRFIYVFSTGDYLDSLTLTGKVTSVEDNSPLPDMVVGLYQWNGAVGDSTPLLEKPYYYAITEKNGTFTLKFLKEGKYRLLAFDDENGNFMYDVGLEVGGFVPYSVNPENDDMLQIVTFQPAPSLRLTDQRFFHPQGVRLVFNKRIEKLDIDFIYPKLDSLPRTTFSMERDTVKLWFDEKLDSLKFAITKEDKIDTVKLKTRKNLSFQPEIKPTFGSELAPDKNLKFRSNIPISSLDTAAMFIVKDSLKLLIKDFDFTADGTFTLHFNRRGHGKYRLSMGANAITYLDGTNPKDSLNFIFDILEKDEYGKLDFTVQPGRTDSLVIIIYQGDKPFFRASISDTAHFNFPYLKPGTYSMEAIVDWNGNGRWDPGNFLRNRLPEPMISNSKTVEIKANWDLEFVWEIQSEFIKRPEEFLREENEAPGADADEESGAGETSEEGELEEENEPEEE